MYDFRFLVNPMGFTALEGGNRRAEREADSADGRKAGVSVPGCTTGISRRPILGQAAGIRMVGKATKVAMSAITELVA